MTPKDEAVKEMIERLKEGIEEFNGRPRDLFAEALTMLLALSQQAAVSRRLAIEEAARLMDDITGEGSCKPAPGRCARGQKFGYANTENGGCPKCGATSDQNCPGDLFDGEKVAAAIRALSPTLDLDTLVDKGAMALAKMTLTPELANFPERARARAVITALIGEP